MENQEIKKTVPVELDDDALEKIGGGMVRTAVVPLGNGIVLSPSTLTKNLDQEKTGFSRDPENYPAFPGTQTTPQILGGLGTDLANSTPSQGENSPVRELVSIEDLIANMANGNS